MSNLNVSLPVEGGTMGAYLVKPASGKGPGIVMLQEIFGVNHAMKAKADHFAELGFTVLVPDIFWRQEPGISLDYNESDRAKGFGHLQALDFPKAVADCCASLEFLKAHEATNGKAAFVGYCLGGKLAVLSASQGGAEACVSFYGVKLEDNHDQIGSMPCPLQMHVGTDDEHVPMPVVEGLGEVANASDGVELFVYDGAKHGFFNLVRESVYDAEASALAEQRVLELFKSTIA